MRKILTLLMVISFATLVLTGCVCVSSPVSNGLIYTGVQGPVAATAADTYSRVGKSSCVAVLGFVSAGNASIDAAMKNGAITKIHHVDHKSTNILGVFAKYTTIVYGQ
jgi:phosphotransacetylase